MAEEEAASADQEATAKSQTPLRKSLTRQNICLNKFLMQMKLPYSGKIATKDIYQSGTEVSTRI